MYGNYSKHHTNQAYDIDFIRYFQGKGLMYRVALIDLLNLSVEASRKPQSAPYS
ncbi:hypothetical protein VCSRO22_3255 [Vibrio cholerae]|nr:hypothetical protein VCSRO22_3255 [Vibrio cholerae]